jgi:hypothetical protein
MFSGLYRIRERPPLRRRTEYLHEKSGDDALTRGLPFVILITRRIQT